MYKLTNIAESINQKGEIFKYVRIGDGLEFDYEFPRGVLQACADQGVTPMERPIITMRDVQLDLVEHHWHLPTFFSLFGPDTFYKILTGVLLERSFVFVHQNY